MCSTWMPARQQVFDSANHGSVDRARALRPTRHEQGRCVGEQAEFGYARDREVLPDSRVLIARRSGMPITRACGSFGSAVLAAT